MSLYSHEELVRRIGELGRENAELRAKLEARPVWTEAQAREAFDQWRKEADPDPDWRYVGVMLGAWLACAHHLGAVKEGER